MRWANVRCSRENTQQENGKESDTWVVEIKRPTQEQP